MNGYCYITGMSGINSKYVGMINECLNFRKENIAVPIHNTEILADVYLKINDPDILEIWYWNRETRLEKYRKLVEELKIYCDEIYFVDSENQIIKIFQR